jgi:ABC-type multidrug transport system fused ATPase/permease subunit
VVYRVQGGCGVQGCGGMWCTGLRKAQLRMPGTTVHGMGQAAALIRRRWQAICCTAVLPAPCQRRHLRLLRAWPAAKSKGAVQRIFPVIDRQSAIDPTSKEGAQPAEVKGEIELRAVTFAYPARPSVMVFNNFSLTIPAGEPRGCMPRCCGSALCRQDVHWAQTGPLCVGLL